MTKRNIFLAVVNKHTMDTFAKRQALNENLAGFEKPTMTTMDILSSIKMLKEQYNNEQDSDSRNIIKSLDALAKSESFLTVKAIQSLQASPLLQQKLGNSWQGVMALSSLLRQRQSENVANKALDGMLVATKLDEQLGARTLAAIQETKLTS